MFEIESKNDSNVKLHINFYGYVNELLATYEFRLSDFEFNG